METEKAAAEAAAGVIPCYPGARDTTHTMEISPLRFAPVEMTQLGLPVSKDFSAFSFRMAPDHYFFFSLGFTPRMVADGTEACFMKALGLIPTMCLNCLEK